MLDHFGVIEDPRGAPKVRYPLREVLFVVVAATIADCEDYDEVADWGEAHLPFLRRLQSGGRRGDHLAAGTISSR